MQAGRAPTPGRKVAPAWELALPWRKGSSRCYEQGRKVAPAWELALPWRKGSSRCYEQAGLPCLAG